MPQTVLRRQVHLDFHTSEHIAGIGARFDPSESPPPSSGRG